MKTVVAMMLAIVSLNVYAETFTDVYAERQKNEQLENLDHEFERQHYWR
jgi:uncharacterized membrane protein affecting hemolysin expression